MTEPDVLERSIREHQEWQRTAWQNLSKPSLTTYESRELRNQIKQSSAELRRYLDMRSERLRVAIEGRSSKLSAALS
jgi:hypothetical protein